MNKIFSIVGAVFFAIATLILTGCSSTPKVENVREVRGQGPYQIGQAPEQRRIENGGKQYDRHVRELQDARLKHEETMVRMEYQKREAEYARTNGLASPQSSTQLPSGPPVVFQQQAWTATRAPVAFMQSPTIIIGPDDLIDGSRPVREIHNLNGRAFCPPSGRLVRYGAGGGGGYTEGRAAYVDSPPGYTEGRNNYTDQRPGYTEGRNNYVEGRAGYTEGNPGYITNPGNSYR